MKIGEFILAFLALLCASIMGACSLIFPQEQKPKAVYYETTLEFYVNPIREGDGQSQYEVYGAYGRHVMDNMVKLLSSENFAEVLMEHVEGSPARYDENGERTEDFQRWLESEEGKKWNADMQCISYSYVKDGVVDQENENPNRIYATISIPKERGKETAEKILEILPQTLIDYVEKHMVLLNGYIGTKCTLLTQSYTINEIEK